MSLSVSSGKQWAEEQSDIHAVKTVAATLTRSYLSVLLLSWNAPTQTPLLRSICKLAIMFDFVHEFDLAARPSVSEISTCFWQQNSVQMMLKEITRSWQLSVNRVSVVNLFLSPPVLVEASLLPWVSQTPNVFLDVICPWFRPGTRNVGPIGWNKFTYFSVYWQKECAWSCFCAKLQ